MDNVNKNVHIEGDKNGFNSKMAVDKFRSSVKNMDRTDSKINLDELQNKFIKSNYKLELVNYDPSNEKIIFKVLEVPTNIPISTDKRKLLKDRLKLMSKDRKKMDYYKAKSDDNVTDEIVKEYMKLKKISKIPVPEPNEILSNPEQYKPILSMVLNNKMINQMGGNHPYIRYFKLIAEKLNIQPQIVESPQTETLNEPEDTIPTLVGNKISNDEDTDDEDSS